MDLQEFEERKDYWMQMEKDEDENDTINHFAKYIFQIFCSSFGSITFTILRM